MNLSNVEQGLLAWAMALANAERADADSPPVFTLETTGARVSMHTNVGSDDLPGAHPFVIFGVPDAGKVVGNLYNPVIRACTSVPVLSGNFSDESSLAIHRELTALLSSWFVSGNIAALYAALTTAGSISCTDLYVQAGQEARVTTKSGQPAWQFEQPVKLCLFQN